ncbi:DNA replication protein [Tulasnella sp. 425]|nr:DNA replication protein [Tulasnella sp. 425]
MDTDYYSIDSILAENHKIQCTFKIDVPGLGYIDGGNEKDIKAGTKMLLPYWLAPTLSLQDWVDVEIPQPFGAKVKRALAADARSVKLSNLVGGTGTWYGFGKMMADLLQDPQSSELSATLLNVSGRLKSFLGLA